MEGTMKEKTISSGTGTADPVNWETEDSYWRENFATRPYTTEALDYGAYQYAYRYGYDLYNRNTGRRFEDLSEGELQRGWEKMELKAQLKWERAKDAVRDAYNRLFAYNRGEEVAYEYRKETV
jgi:hypothetical protein